MQASEHTFLPTPVRNMVNRLHEATKHEPEVERIADRWRIIMRSSRVLMTYDMKLFGRNRYERSGSTLSVDGQRRALAADFEDFVRIFADPDGQPAPAEDQLGQAIDTINDRSECDNGPVTLPPIVPVQVADAPASIREMHAALAPQLEKLGELLVGQNGTKWVIGIDSNGVQFRMHLHQVQGGRFEQVANRPIQIVLDGIDYTDFAGGDIVKALSLLTKKPGTNAPPPVRRPSQAKVTPTGVQTRKTVVRRV